MSHNTNDSLPTADTHGIPDYVNNASEQNENGASLFSLSSDCNAFGWMTKSVDFKLTPDDKNNYDLQDNDVLVTSYGIFDAITYNSVVSSATLTFKGKSYAVRDYQSEQEMSSSYTDNFKILVWDLMSVDYAFEQELAFKPTHMLMSVGLISGSYIYTTVFYNATQMLGLNGTLNIFLSELNFNVYFRDVKEAIYQLALYYQEPMNTEYHVSSFNKKVSNLIPSFDKYYTNFPEKQSTLPALGFLDTFSQIFNPSDTTPYGNILWVTVANCYYALTGHPANYFPRQIVSVLVAPNTVCIKSRVKTKNFVIKTLTNDMFASFISTNSNLMFPTYGAKLAFDYILSFSLHIEVGPNTRAKLPKLYSWYKHTPTAHSKTISGDSLTISSLGATFFKFVDYLSSCHKPDVVSFLMAELSYVHSCEIPTLNYNVIFNNHAEMSLMSANNGSPHDHIYSLLVARYSTPQTHMISGTPRSDTDDCVTSNSNHTHQCGLDVKCLNDIDIQEMRKMLAMKDGQINDLGDEILQLKHNALSNPTITGCQPGITCVTLDDFAQTTNEVGRLNSLIHDTEVEMKKNFSELQIIKIDRSVMSDKLAEKEKSISDLHGIINGNDLKSTREKSELLKQIKDLTTKLSSASIEINSLKLTCAASERSSAVLSKTNLPQFSVVPSPNDGSALVANANQNPPSINTSSLDTGKIKQFTDEILSLKELILKKDSEISDLKLLAKKDSDDFYVKEASLKQSYEKQIFALEQGCKELATKLKKTEMDNENLLKPKTICDDNCHCKTIVQTISDNHKEEKTSLLNDIVKLKQTIEKLDDLRVEHETNIKHLNDEFDTLRKDYLELGATNTYLESSLTDEKLKLALNSGKITMEFKEKLSETQANLLYFESRVDVVHDLYQTELCERENYIAEVNKYMLNCNFPLPNLKIPDIIYGKRIEDEIKGDFDPVDYLETPEVKKQSCKNLSNDHQISKTQLNETTTPGFINPVYVDTIIASNYEDHDAQSTTGVSDSTDDVISDDDSADEVNDNVDDDINTPMSNIPSRDSSIRGIILHKAKLPVSVIPRNSSNVKTNCCPDSIFDIYHYEAMSAILSIGPLLITLKDGTVVDAKSVLHMKTTDLKYDKPIPEGKHVGCTIYDCNYWLNAGAPNDKCIAKDLPKLYRLHCENASKPGYISQNFVTDPKLAENNLFTALDVQLDMVKMSDKDINVWLDKLMSGTLTQAPAAYNTFINSSQGYDLFKQFFMQALHDNPKLTKLNPPFKKMSTHFDRLDFISWFMYEYNLLTHDGSVCISRKDLTNGIFKRSSLESRQFCTNVTQSLSNWIYFDPDYLPDLSAISDQFLTCDNRPVHHDINTKIDAKLRKPTGIEKNNTPTILNDDLINGYTNTVFKSVDIILTSLLSNVTIDHSITNTFLDCESTATSYGMSVAMISIFLKDRPELHEKLKTIASHYNNYFCDHNTVLSIDTFPIRVVGYVFKISAGVRYTDLNRAIAMNVIKMATFGITMDVNFELLPIIFDQKYSLAFRQLMVKSPTYRALYKKMCAIRDPLIFILSDYDSNVFFKLSETTRPLINSKNFTELCKKPNKFDASYIKHLCTLGSLYSLIPINIFPTFVTDTLVFLQDSTKKMNSYSSTVSKTSPSSKKQLDASTGITDVKSNATQSTNDVLKNSGLFSNSDMQKIDTIKISQNQKNSLTMNNSNVSKSSTGNVNDARSPSNLSFGDFLGQQLTHTMQSPVSTQKKKNLIPISRKIATNDSLFSNIN